MLISLIHPSRGRPEQAGITASIWKERAGVETEWLLCIDEDDPSDYSMYYTIKNIRPDVVSATNTAAKLAKGDILAYVSDDMVPMENWGVEVEKLLKNPTRSSSILKPDDCLQPYRSHVITAPLMTIAAYRRLGYFWYPEYKSMWVDCDLYEVAKRHQMLIGAPHIKIEHRHYSVNKAKVDDTYKRSEANWQQGLDIFNRRKRQGFPI